jgi:hypothetical protein
VLAQMPGVRPEPGRPGLLVAGLHRLEVAAERDLRVDDNVLAAGQAHHEVGAHPALVGGHRRLGDVVDVLGEPGRLDGTLELQLSPPAAHLRRPQCRHQLSRLGAQLLGGLAHRADLLEQRRVRARALAFDRPKLLLHAFERVAKRSDHALDGLLPLGEIAGSGSASGPQPRLGQCHERLVVAAQRVPGQRSERLAQPLVLVAFGRADAVELST